MAHKYLKPPKKSCIPKIIVIVLAVIVTCALILCLFGRGSHKYETVSIGMDAQQAEPTETHEIKATEAAAMEEIILLMPWEANGAKKPEEYTLSEYEGLNEDQRKAFLSYLGAEAYAAWLERAEAEAAKMVEIPWNDFSAKQPRNYTWAEYQALTAGQQKAFMEALGPHGLEEWLQNVQGGGSQSVNGTNSSQGGNTSQNGNSQSGNNGQSVKDFYPWRKPGAKKAEDYTWQEYNSLSPVQQKAFRNHLGKQGYQTWLEKVTKVEYPWDRPGSRQPLDYTWEDYVALTNDQKIGFYQKLGKEGFDKWLEKLQPEEKYPWEESGAKQPKDYTWEEFLALTPSQQMAFQNHMGKTFETWMADAQAKPETNPWETPGAKQPKDYTWQEYNALSEKQQMAFQTHMGANSFAEWMKKAQNTTAVNPWDAPGAKQPGDYTWEEFCALTGNEQIAFQAHLGDQRFEAWMQKAQETAAAKPVRNPWDASGAKQPKDYTWQEFSALSGAEQVAFQEHLGSQAFEEWLQIHQPKPEDKPTEPPVVYPWDASGAKQPKDYTWEEFQALTGNDQIAFQAHLGAEGFGEWLSRNQEKPAETPTEPPVVYPWDVSGAKQPEDYTWEEFLTLTGNEQIAFQNHMGMDAFETWLNNVQEMAEAVPEGNAEESAEAYSQAVSDENSEITAEENP